MWSSTVLAFRRRTLPQLCSANRNAWFWLILFLATLQAGAQPSNDGFSARATIVETNFTVWGTLAGATSESGEPFLPNISSGQTAWWTWTAPSNGSVRLSATGYGFAPLLTVYRGTELFNLSLVSSNNHLICYEHAECGCHWRVRNQATFQVRRSEAYQIAIDSAVTTDASRRHSFGAPEPEIVLITNRPPGGAFTLNLQLTPAPKNDEFEGRVKITGSRRHFRASNAGASKQPGESDHLENPGGSSVWYSWTAPASGRVTLSKNEIPPYSPPSWNLSHLSVSTTFPRPSCGKEIDQHPAPPFFPLFAAYTGSSLESLTSANCLPLALAAYPHAVSFEALKGQTYEIAFDGNQGATGEILFYLALTKPAANDTFSRRIRLRGTQVFASGYNAGATSQAGESVAFENSTGKTVWWSWKAPVSGTVSVDLSGSDYPFPVAVFTGEAIPELLLVGSGSSSNRFEAIAGQTYQIAVGDAAGLTGAIQLRLRAPTVELPLLSMLSSAKAAVLRYSATSGQVILLLRSSDGATWENAGKAVARRGAVSFLVRPPPGSSGPWYQAVVFDSTN
jgi:hypothetical protein